MKLHKFSLLAFALSLFSTYVSAQGRIVQKLDFGWKFIAGDIKDAADPAFDDSQWRTINLPHDFQIEQPWVAPAADEKADNDDPAANIKSRLSSRGFKEMGRGWYRLHLTPADSLRNKRLLIDFGGIMYVGDVYVNGELAGKTDYGYVGFEVDVTGKLKCGQDNVIAVMADTREPNNSRWYTGGGLFRSVRLVATDRNIYFARHPLRITTSQHSSSENVFSSSESWYVAVTAEVVTKGRDKRMPVRLRIIAPDGIVVYDATHEVIRTTPTRTVEQQLAEIKISDPQIWDIDTPNLYTIEATLCNEKGDIVDSYTEHFGIRTVEIGPDFGLKLNGRKVLLQGYANHHTLGALGAAAYPRAIEKRIQMMKEWGINHIRTSHNPYSREFIELCDRYGILVVDELYDKWTRQHTGGRADFTALWQNDVPEWVKRDRNSPSVIAWSLGNELQQDANIPFNDWGVTMYRLMRPLIQRYDSTRLVTVAMHPRYRNWQTDSLPCDLAMQTDFQAYNYRYMYFPGDGRRFPWMTFYQSEASIAAMGANFFEMDLSRVMGLAYWGAIDYLGESQGWPAKGWAQGVFDIALNPKPKAYYMRSFFKPDEPVVHIGIIDRQDDVMWNGIQTGNDGMSDHWNREAGSKYTAVVFTNAEEVELMLNGHSLSTKKNPVDNPKTRNQLRWSNVEYQPGRLVAIARTNGREVARHQIETTAEAVRLTAKADQAEWKADGMDLQHVTISVADKKGRIVQTTSEEVTFRVEGEAQIVGVINGDISSDELTVGNTRRLYNGSCTVILRSTRQTGSVVLTATAPGLKPVTLRMKTL